VDPLTTPRVAEEGPCARARDEARLGLYVHVPFCATHCTYCDFSSGTLSSEAVERYLSGMARECEQRRPVAAGQQFTSVFFGGGTPSALAPRAFVRLAAMLRSNFSIASGAEITLEANPESVRPALLEAWAGAGVNRLSMGAQSFVPEELERLGRIHPAGRPGEAFALARQAGFERLSLDLMYGFPGHTSGHFAHSLDETLALEPEHVSAYCFIPEPGTPLGNAVAAGVNALPPPEAQADLYAQLTDRLGAAGLGCYETSNFARTGAEARHNLVYWLRRPYLGVGPSAHGFFDGARYGNHYALARWAAGLAAGNPEAERELETPERTAEEIVLLGLRLASGIRVRDYSDSDWLLVERRHGDAFERGLATGRLIGGGESWRIPESLRFLADDVIAWLTAQSEAASFDSRRAGSVTSSPCPSHPFQAV
jgi:oxygen-independent coproporphyrinogen-3 oxidase